MISLLDTLQAIHELTADLEYLESYVTYHYLHCIFLLSLMLYSYLYSSQSNLHGLHAAIVSIWIFLLDEKNDCSKDILVFYNEQRIKEIDITHSLPNSAGSCSDWPSSPWCWSYGTQESCKQRIGKEGLLSLWANFICSRASLPLRARNSPGPASFLLGLLILTLLTSCLTYWVSKS